MSDDVAFLSITALGEAYRKQRLSPVDVTKFLIARIAKLDPTLNAFIKVLEKESFAEAETAERQLRAGEDLGPLHGVPIAIKDMIAMAGLPTTFASHGGSPQTPTRDANLIQNLRKAGAVFIGKTNLLEYAYGAVHPDFGQTNNPWDPKRTSGGSSGGSTAAVASGLAYGAVGTDTGGSIRIPAAYCGVPGLKPTHGRVDVDGVAGLSWSLDHAGALARSSVDVAIMLAGMTGAPWKLPPVTLSGLRIGLLQHSEADRWLEPGVRALFDQACDVLKTKGATLRAIALPPQDEITNAIVHIIEPEASFIHREMMESKAADGLSATTRAQFQAGFGISAVSYIQALRVQRRIRAQFEDVFKDFDTVLSPAVAWVAPAEDPPMGDPRGTAEMLFSGIQNLLGIPALSIPCGLTEQRLPAGLQIATKWGADELALAIGAALEPHLPQLGNPPVS